MATKEAQRLAKGGLATLEEAMSELGIEKTKLYELMNSRELPYLRPARKRMIPWQAIEDYAARKLDEINNFS